MNKIFCFVSAIIFSSTLSASSINIEIQYQEAQSGKTLRDARSVDLADTFMGASCVSNVGMHKTVFAIKLSNLIKSSLTSYHAALKHWYEVYPRPVALHDRRPCPVPVINWDRIKTEHSFALLANLEKLQAKEPFAFDNDVSEATLLGKKLADNMLKGEFGPVFDTYVPQPRPKAMAGSNMAARTAPSNLNVTAGGIKDYSHFKKQVDDGYVPVPDAFIEEGFLSSFDLGLQASACDQLICLNPAYAYDPETHKLFVQIGMNSNSTSESFQRPPVNLAFVIDISGSMAATTTRKNAP